MKERPILFSGPMVRAILEGRKTQARRIIKPQPSPCGLRLLSPGDITATGLDATYWYGSDPFTEAVKCPYGGRTDRLWVKETWCAWDTACEEQEADEVAGNVAHLVEMGIGRWHITYRADPRRHAEKWRPSIFMPRWASRITLEIEAVRVERLIEITREDCIAEGVSVVGNPPKWGVEGSGRCLCWMQPEGAYRELWESINGLGSWDANPWVWVIQFRRVQ